MTVRVSVRRSVYRDVPGWLVVEDGGRFSVFFEHESAARRTAKRRRENPEYATTMADFEPDAVTMFTVERYGEHWFVMGTVGDNDPRYSPGDRFIAAVEDTEEAAGAALRRITEPKCVRCDVETNGEPWCPACGWNVRSAGAITPRRA